MPPRKSSRRSRDDDEEREARIAEMIGRAKKHVGEHQRLIEEIERHLKEQKNARKKKRR